MNSDSIKNLSHQLVLGKRTVYGSHYNANLLQTVPRSINRDTLDIRTPFYGYDVWHHYEISYLNHRGKPEVAVGILYIPATSESIIESKSLKLYFNSFNMTRFINLNAVRGTVQSLDDLDIEIDTYALTPEFITQDEGGEVVSEELCSDLLKSNCLITGQPDWGSVYIRYTGRKISHEGLLRYIISMRTHNEFHEHCVERIFTDIANRCSVTYLEVRAFYTRRGGLDINPVRATCELPCESARLIRQ